MSRFQGMLWVTALTWGLASCTGETLGPAVIDGIAEYNLGNGLKLTGSSSSEASGLTLNILVTNESAESSRVEWACARRVELRVFSSAERALPAKFDSSRLHSCTGPTITDTIPARSSRVFSANFSHVGILGDSLPSGRYFFNAIPRINAVGIPALYAGSGNLTR